MRLHFSSLAVILSLTWLASMTRCWGATLHQTGSTKASQKNSSQKRTFYDVVLMQKILVVSPAVLKTKIN